MRTSQDDLVRAMAMWVEWLADWKVFFTLTFRYESSVWSAQRVFVRFMKGALPSVSYFYAIEANPGRHGSHIHGIWDSSEAPRKATHREWLERYGRNRIEPVRGLSAVERYCGKYVCKDSAWWNFYLTPAQRGKENSPHFPLGEFLGASELNVQGQPKTAAGVTRGAVCVVPRVDRGAPAAMG